MRYLLQCRSLTYAQRTERALALAGITGTVTRLPRIEGVRGCAYGVLISPRHLTRARQTLERAGLMPERIFLREPNGSLREVGDDDLA